MQVEKGYEAEIKELRFHQNRLIKKLAEVSYNDLPKLLASLSRLTGIICKVEALNHKKHQYMKDAVKASPNMQHQEEDDLDDTNSAETEIESRVKEDDLATENENKNVFLKDEYFGDYDELNHLEGLSEEEEEKNESEENIDIFTKYEIEKRGGYYS